MRIRFCLFAALLLACGPRLHQRAATVPVVREMETPRAPAAADTGQIVRIPAPTGPYRVGRATFHAIDPARDEAFTPEPDDRREVIFHVWYPAAEEGGVPAAFTAEVPDDSIFRRSYSFIGVEKLPRVRANAFADAPVSGAERRYPVILFSHGLGAVAAMYTSFQEDLASHGYVVVGVDHPYFSAAFQLPGGRTVRNLSRPASRQQDVLTQAQDLRFVLDALELLDREGPGRLRGRLDLERVGVFGQSRGGFAAPHACRLDRRFDACANLDGYSLTPAVMDSGIAQPYLHVEELVPWQPAPTDSELVAAGQTREQAIAEAAADSLRREATFRRMGPGAVLVTVRGARHASFSDQPLIAPERYRDIAIDARRALQITRAYLLAFFDLHLRNRPPSLLGPIPPPYPEVTVEFYDPAGPTRVLRGTVP
ncbi:MAG TPA: hypothetical protein VHG08_08175 [Longimicrobium sp.]|nr:hypothetical protein [Longimicrobium sp.]